MAVLSEVHHACNTRIATFVSSYQKRTLYQKFSQIDYIHMDRMLVANGEGN